MFDFLCLASLIKGVSASGCALSDGVAVGELTAVVGEQLVDFDRTFFMQAAQEVGTAGFRWVVVDAEKHPAGSAINRYKHLASFSFIKHLGQVFDVHMNKAGNLIPEGFQSIIEL